MRRLIAQLFLMMAIGQQCVSEPQKLTVDGLKLGKDDPKIVYRLKKQGFVFTRSEEGSSGQWVAFKTVVTVNNAGDLIQVSGESVEVNGASVLKIGTTEEQAKHWIDANLRLIQYKPGAAIEADSQSGRERLICYFWQGKVRRISLFWRADGFKRPMT